MAAMDLKSNAKTILTAVFGLTLIALATPSYANGFLLTPSKTQLEWQGWTIKIDRLSFVKAIKRSYGDAKIPDPDSEFVYLDVTVKNSSHKGQSFIPQNEVKIMIGEDAFDAEDIDSSSDYVKNIEPTLLRRRECYFELPKALVKGTFLLRFSRLFTDAVDVPVSIDVSNLTEDDETRKQNDTELSKISPSVPAAIPIPTHESFSLPTPEVDTYADSASAETELNDTWSKLSARQRSQLRQEERTWIGRKDAIVSTTRRTLEVRARTQYLLSFIGN